MFYRWLENARGFTAVTQLDPAIETIKHIAASSPFCDDSPAAIIDDYAETLGDAPAERVQYLERELTAALYALWRVQGVRKRIVKLP